LTPDFGGAVGPDKLMLGLRVREVTPASFWDQIGLRPGDLLTEMNGAAIDSLDAWKNVLQLAQTKQRLTVKVQRGTNELAFRTITVRPG
jgi:S1-C subfamily serine protease